MYARYIAGLSAFSANELFVWLTKIFSAVKERLQKYCYTVYSHSGINHMWILKTSKERLENLSSRSFSKIKYIETFDVSTLYTNVPREKLKTRLNEIIHNAFLHKNDTIHTTISLCCDQIEPENKSCYTEQQVISSLIHNIFVECLLSV